MVTTLLHWCVAYLRPLQNDDSGLFIEDLNIVPQHLFDEHGTITPQELDSEWLFVYFTDATLLASTPSSVAMQPVYTVLFTGWCVY